MTTRSAFPGDDSYGEEEGSQEGGQEKATAKKKTVKKNAAKKKAVKKSKKKAAHGHGRKRFFVKWTEIVNKYTVFEVFADTPEEARHAVENERDRLVAYLNNEDFDEHEVISKDSELKVACVDAVWEADVDQTEQEEEYSRDDEEYDERDDDDEEEVLTKAFAEQFIASEAFFDLSEYSQIDDEAAQLFQKYLPDAAWQRSVTGVERLRAGSVLGVLGVYFEDDGDIERAWQCYEKSVELHADVSTGFWGDLAQLKSELGDDALSKAFDLYNDSFEATTFSKFCKLLKKAIKECPSYPWAYNNLAWRLATSAVDDERDGTAAVELATKACELCDHPYMTSTLAAAYAEAGNFEKATTLQQQAIEMSTAVDVADGTKLTQYKKRRAWRED